MFLCIALVTYSVGYEIEEIYSVAVCHPIAQVIIHTLTRIRLLVIFRLV